MSNPVISQENLPTVVAVSFIVALLAVALTVVNYQRTSQVAAAVAGFEVGDSKQEKAAADAQAKQMAALEGRIAELEKAAAAASAQAAAPAEEAEGDGE